MNATRVSKQALPWLVAAMLGAATVPAYAVDCAAPKGISEVRGCQAAKQGAEALRRYVERTRMIHSLYYWDFAPYASGEKVAKADDKATMVAVR